MTILTHGKERLSQEQRDALVQQNIAEMGMFIGGLIREGQFPQSDLDVSSSVISHSIMSWAKEFEDKYQGPDFDYGKGIPELGDPAGYLDAIDNFTDLKMREAGWLTEEYINDEKRFWHNMEYYVDIEFRVTRTIKVKAFSKEDAIAQAEAWWEQVSLPEAIENADDMDEFYIKETLRVEDAGK
ncbi:hypothetical protein [Paenibacillus glucanolyticus]|uniref:hypothetical protein n=1 Tax=Paenibacillus glucanolyticus TaxID=59843 RepID=UPI00096D0C67|nr:hypothetical protein [Paenibacillus glucanolyticus]OMF76730.1 hypothetical protein BK142_14515 [Paenibacillus glucanolyticus]